MDGYLYNEEGDYRSEGVVYRYDGSVWRRLGEEEEEPKECELMKLIEAETEEEVELRRRWERKRNIEALKEDEEKKKKGVDK